MTLIPSQIKGSIMIPNSCTARGVKVMTACRVEKAITEAPHKLLTACSS